MAEWGDRRPQRDRVMEEMEESRDARTRNAFRSAGYGDQGPAGVGRVDPASREDRSRLSRGWERVRRDGFDADRDPERVRDRGTGGSGGGSGVGGTGLGELYGRGEDDRGSGRVAGQQARPDHRGRGPRGYKRSDARIEEEVNDRLTQDPHIDATEVQVDVKGGEVTLTGNVDDRRARRHAEDIAESVSGVTYVLNNLRVRQPGTTGATG